MLDYNYLGYVHYTAYPDECCQRPYDTGGASCIIAISGSTKHRIDGSVYHIERKTSKYKIRNLRR